MHLDGVPIALSRVSPFRLRLDWFENATTWKLNESPLNQKWEKILMWWLNPLCPLIKQYFNHMMPIYVPNIVFISSIPHPYILKINSCWFGKNMNIRTAHPLSVLFSRYIFFLLFFPTVYRYLFGQPPKLNIFVNGLRASHTNIGYIFWNVNYVLIDVRLSTNFTLWNIS